MESQKSFSTLMGKVGMGAIIGILLVVTAASAQLSENMNVSATQMESREIISSCGYYNYTDTHYIFELNQSLNGTNCLVFTGDDYDIWGNGYTVSGSGTCLTMNGTNITVRDIELKNCDYGLNITDGTNINVSNVDFQNNAIYDLYLENNENMSMTDTTPQLTCFDDNIPDFSVINSNGRIEWLVPVGVTCPLDMGDLFRIDPNLARVDGDTYPQFDVPARITLYNMGTTAFYTQPHVYRDGEECEDCTEYFSSSLTNFRWYLNTDTPSFRVEDFSEYEIYAPAPPLGNILFSSAAVGLVAIGWILFILRTLWDVEGPMKLILVMVSLVITIGFVTYLYGIVVI